MPTTDECLSCKQTQDSLAETWQAETAKLREQVMTLEAQLALARTAITELLAASPATMTAQWSEMVERAERALSGDTMQIGQDARVGRALQKWIKDHITVAAEWWSEDIIVDLRRIVAQAKAGEAHG